MRVLRFLYLQLKDRHRAFWTIFLVALVDGAFVSAMALSLSGISALDVVANTQAIYRAVLFLILSLFTSFGIRRYGETLALTIAESVRSNMIAKLTRVPMLHLHRYHSGYVLSLVNRVADTLQPILFNLYWWGARSVIYVAVIVVTVLSQSVLVFVVDVFVIAVFVVVSQWLSVQILFFNKAVNESKSRFMSVFADFAANIATVKRLHIHSYMQSAIARQRALVLGTVHKQQQFHATRWFMLHGLFALLFTLTFGMLLWQLTAGLLSVSGFIVLVWFFWGLRGDLNQLAENLKVYTELGGYIEQLDEVIAPSLASPLPSSASTASINMLEMRDVKFTYPGTKTMVSVPELTIRRGEVVAIIGASGQGKSTLLHIVSGLLQVDTGELRMGFDMAESMLVSQEVELFNATLRENLCLGSDYGDERLMRILRELALDTVVRQHPDGLDVALGEKGLRLSTGQKQRVNIARAFLQERAFYLLDEPIAHLDPKTAQKVVDFLHKHLKGKSAIIISHQPSILTLANRTYQMKRRILVSHDAS